MIWKCSNFPSPNGSLCIWILKLRLYFSWFWIKQWPLAPNSRDSRVTRANLSRRVTFFSKMAFGECRRVWRVRATRLGECWRVWRVRPTRLGECRRVWRVRATRLGECRRVWQVLHISENGHFGEYSHSPKTASFTRVLKFAKFARE
jgi:hypothetical protein